MKIFSWQNAVADSQEIGSLSKLVLFVLGTFLDQNGVGFPSIDTLVAKTGMARASVIKHLGLAEKAGFITKRKHGFGGQKWARNEYSATFPDQCELIRASDAKSDAEKGSSPDEPPMEKAVHLTHKGSSFDSEKAVHQVNSNYPVNYPMNNPIKKLPKKDLILPDWLDAAAWDAFAAHRRAMGAPLKGQAAALNLKTLGQLHRHGHDPTAVIEQSIEMGWKGLFPIKEDHYGKQHTQGNLRHAGQNPASGWRGEGERLAAKYAAEAERLERQEAAAAIANAQPDLCLAEAIRQDARGAGSVGGGV